jgi:hypothetical protein
MSNVKLVIVTALVTFMLLPTAHAKKDVKYVGGGRYVCQGSDCEEFDRKQARENQRQDDAERRHRESRQDTRDLIDALEKDDGG